MFYYVLHFRTGILEKRHLTEENFHADPIPMAACVQGWGLFLQKANHVRGSSQRSWPSLFLKALLSAASSIWEDDVQSYAQLNTNRGINEAAADTDC